MELTAKLASRFAQIALGHVTREWPNKLDHVMAGTDDICTPRALHPVFFGSFDWHSAVHGHWLLARLYRRFPDLPEAGAIHRLFDGHFTAENLATELAYLARPYAGGFERPYGWAWLLMLAGELARHRSEDAARWHNCLQPLADAFAAKFRTFLPLATYPVRAGVHSNTAFSLILAHEYSVATKDADLATLCAQTAWRWYRGDTNFRSLEPSQDEFLSPSLSEAACTRIFLDKNAFAPWLGKFLPDLSAGQPAALFVPAFVSDRTDGKIAHLDGLNLSRAWCWRLICDGLARDHPVQGRAFAAIDAHLAAALPYVADDYMGEHWLASFALLALDPDAA